MAIALMTRAALYTRVSTTHQHAENQEADVMGLVAQRGWEVVGRYTDILSATKRRPALEKLLGDAHRGRFDVLVVWTLDRLGRSMAENVSVLLTLDRLNVRVVSVRESWLSTEGPARSLLIAVMSWVAEQELARIRERTRAGLERARRAGTKLGRPRVEANLDEIRALRAKGASFRTIAKKMGIGATTVQRLLDASEALLDRGSKNACARGSASRS